jgi:hypothetical protein
MKVGQGLDPLPHLDLNKYSRLPKCQYDRFGMDFVERTM